MPDSPSYLVLPLSLDLLGTLPMLLEIVGTAETAFKSLGRSLAASFSEPALRLPQFDAVSLAAAQPISPACVEGGWRARA